MAPATVHCCLFIFFTLGLSDNNSYFLKITFLGTGTSQGVPVIACECRVCRSSDTRDKRLRTSLLVESGNTVFSIDAGPDFRQQMLREGVLKLDAIVITHEHKDHIGGMDDVRAFNYKTDDAISIYAEERVQKAIRREYEYVFTEYKYPGVPRMRLITVNEAPFYIGDIRIIPVRAYHHNLPIMGFRIGNMAYITDANMLPVDSRKKLRGIRFLIVNALRKEPHLSHFCLDEAINLSAELAPELTYLTHISHTMGLYEEVSKLLPPGIELAYDGLSFQCNI